MEKHNIDKLFSDKLAGHTPAFNPAHWSQMEGVIQAQGNSGSLLWWMIGTGLMVLTLVGLGSNHYLRASEAQTLQIESSSVSHEAIVFKIGRESTEEQKALAFAGVKRVDQIASQNEKSVFENDASDLKASNPIHENSVEHKSAALDKTGQQDLPLKGYGSEGESEEQGVDESQKTERIEQISTEKTTDVTGEYDTQAAGNSENMPEIFATNTAPDFSTQAVKNEGHGALENSSDKGEGTSTTKSNSFEANSSTIPVHLASFKNSTTTSNLSIQGDRNSSLPGIGMNPLSILNPKSHFENEIGKPEFVTPKLKNLPPREFYKPYKWNLAVSAGVNGSTKLIESDYNFLTSFVDKRNTEEQSNITPSFGLELSYVPGRISISTGLHFNSLSYDANYTPTESLVADSLIDNSYYELTTWEEMVIDTIWNQDTTGGMGPFVIDTLYFTFVDSLLVESFDTTFTSQIQEFEQGLATSYQYLEIPIHVGYTVPLGQKGTHLGVFGGASITYLRSTSGSYINQGLSEIQLAQKKETAIGIDLIARLRLSHAIGYRTGVFIEGRYRHGLGSVSTSADYTEKYRMYGGAIGLMYKF